LTFGNSRAIIPHESPAEPPCRPRNRPTHAPSAATFGYPGTPFQFSTLLFSISCALFCN
jgi:hypothetical protein